MGTPGSNLLEEAFEVIETQPIQWMEFIERTLNPVGQYIGKWKDPVTVEASVQAVDRKTYVELGLDFQKDYVTIYACVDFDDLDRDVTGDRIFLEDGKLYQLESLLPWFDIDGWVGAVAVIVNNVEETYNPNAPIYNNVQVNGIWINDVLSTLGSFSIDAHAWITFVDPPPKNSVLKYSGEIDGTVYNQSEFAFGDGITNMFSLTTKVSSTSWLENF